MKLKRKTLILFLVFLSFLITSCKSKESNYPKYLFYNTVVLENDENIEINDINMNIDFEEDNNSYGKYESSFAIKNNTNSDKVCKLSNLLVDEYDNIMRYNWDGHLKIIVNGNPISYSLKPGKFLDKLPLEDFNFNEIRDSKIDLDYKPKNFDLDTIIYKYKISVADINPKLEFKKNNSDDTFVIHTYQDSDYRENKAMNITENGSVFSYKYPLEEIKINKEIVNKDSKKTSKDIDLEIIEGKMTMQEFIDSVYKDRSPIEKNMVMEYLDNYLENNDEKVLNIINLLYDAFQKERPVFLDYDIKVPAKSSTNISVIYPIDKTFELTNPKKIYLDIFSNPKNAWKESNNFNLNLKLNNKFSSIIDSNINLKEIDLNNYNYSNDKLPEDKINIEFGK